MKTEELAKILEASRQYWQTGGEEGAIADLRGADLYGADLYGADLYGASGLCSVGFASVLV